MLLVITPSAKARGCAQAIQQVTSEETHVAATLSQAMAQLRAQEYVAVLIDQGHVLLRSFITRSFISCFSPASS
jgi:hypothetical protein